MADRLSHSQSLSTPETTQRKVSDDDAGAGAPVLDSGGVGVGHVQALMSAGGNLGMVQLHGDGGGTDHIHAAAAHGVQGGGGALPHLGQIQDSFGQHDVSNVQAHTGSAATEATQAMGAEAYATGNHVAFGAGATDLHTAAHEAAHVVQQRGGVSLSGGVGSVGDSYENHADAVADKVVKGESAEGLLNTMSGGSGGAGVQKKAASAGAVQLRAVQMDVGDAPPADPGDTPTPADPEAEWRTFCDGLDGPVKTAASGLTGDDRDKFKALNPVEQRTFGAIDASLRPEFLGFARWQDRTAMTVMVAAPPHLAQYTGLAATLRAGYRALTPDERGDMVALEAPRVTELLTVEAKLNEWRTFRNVAALQGQPGVAAALSIDASDPAAIGAELAALSAGQAGERLRRLINEEGFENAAHRPESIEAIRTKVRDESKDPWTAMTELKPTYMLKGKLTKADSGWQNVPVLKAVAHKNIVQYGLPKAGFALQLLRAVGKEADADAQRDISGPGTDRAATGLRGQAFTAWHAAGGSLDVGAHIASYSVEGRAKAGAYWMYDGTASAVLNPTASGQDIIQLCAIEESPEYNMGFVILQLPTSDPALEQRVRRPTMWDGLQFDQFAGVEDASQCYGVTSGGMGEVVVAPTALSACTIARNVAM